MQEVKALVRLCVCTGSSEPSLLADAKITNFTCVGPYAAFLVTYSVQGVRFELLFHCHWYSVVFENSFDQGPVSLKKSE